MNSFFFFHLYSFFLYLKDFVSLFPGLHKFFWVTNVCNNCISVCNVSFFSSCFQELFFNLWLSTTSLWYIFFSLYNLVIYFSFSIPDFKNYVCQFFDNILKRHWITFISMKKYWVLCWQQSTNEINWAVKQWFYTLFKEIYHIFPLYFYVVDLNSKVCLCLLFSLVY